MVNSLDKIYEIKDSLVKNQNIVIALLLLIGLAAGILYTPPPKPGVTLEDCRDDYSIDFGEIEYNPEDQSAFIEVNSTEGLNSTNFRKISLQISDGETQEVKGSNLSIGNKSSSGVIAATNSDSTLEFPLQPFNMTINGGLGPEEIVLLAYTRANMDYPNSCQRESDILIFKTNETGLKWRWRS